MDAYIPWNVGNYAGAYAQTEGWAADKSAMASAGGIYMPLVYPGFSWDNLMNQPPGTTTKSRLKGIYMWRQFLDAKRIGAQVVYIAMFDEIDEGTAIFKVANDIPVNHHFINYEGLPSDFYLLMAGYGSRIIHGELPFPGSMPDFAGQSQPSIPEILSPAYDDSVNKDVRLSWDPAKHASGIQYYELEVDRGGTVQLTDTFMTASVSAGSHEVRVRAVNDLQNRGGWSETVVFHAREKPSMTVTFTASIPANTPAADTVYIAGNFNSWDPGPEQAGTAGMEHNLQMHKTGDNQWQITLTFTIGFSLEYKYTRGGWSKVENGAGGEEIANRQLIVPGADYTENDAVASWADLGTDVSARGAGEPAAFQLYQNHPNPFNDATMIRYVIPRSAHVLIEMINIRGERVNRLVDRIEEAGSHQIILNSAAMSSGIYFITIVAGKDAGFKKILLIR
jgi:hypothetical protein